MNFFSYPKSVIACMAGMLTLTMSCEGATILTFDRGAGAGTGKISLSTAGYGNRANAGGVAGGTNVPAYSVSQDADGTVGTPNVAITWGSEWHFHYGSNGDPWRAANGIGQFMQSTDRVVTFAPDAGFAVSFGSLDFVGDTNGNNFTITVSIFDALDFAANGKGGAATLWTYTTGSWDVSYVSGSGDYSGATRHMDFGDFTGQDGQALVVLFEKRSTSSGSWYNNIGIDNFSFSQLDLSAIPEPSTATMLGGMLALGLLRRRK